MSNLRTIEALLVITSLSPVLTNQYRLEIAEEATKAILALYEGRENDYYIHLLNLRERSARLSEQQEQLNARN